MAVQDYILSALAEKTVVFVTHQVEFLPAADLILVRKSFSWFYYVLILATVGPFRIAKGSLIGV